MSVFKGNTATTATSTAKTIPASIVSFSVANKTGGAVTASVGILYGSTFYIIYTKPLAAAGSAGSEYIYAGEPITLPIGNQIFVSVSGSCDYYFSLKGDE